MIFLSKQYIKIENATLIQMHNEYIFFLTSDFIAAQFSVYATRPFPFIYCCQTSSGKKHNIYDTAYIKYYTDGVCYLLGYYISDKKHRINAPAEITFSSNFNIVIADYYRMNEPTGERMCTVYHTANTPPELIQLKDHFTYIHTCQR